MAPGKDEDLTTPQAIPSLTGVTHNYDPIREADLGRAPAHVPHPPSLLPQVRDQRRYQFLGEHGRGGLGRVLRAHDRDLGRDVAIKELLARSNANDLRFLREVLITARLEHPGIVPVHEVGRWADGTPFYAMKLVAGRSLHDLIAERTTVEDRIGLLHHVIAVADAIAYAHGRGVIHRDLKPANVIVGEFGETIVIDWGLAKDLSSDETSGIGSGPFHVSPGDDLTSVGTVLGTPAYMAPEQKRGEPVDKRADVFAIGVMLWRLCAPQTIPPDSKHVRHRVLRRAGIDEDLATIIEKALDPDPERRYPDAGALAADLKAFKSGARIAARTYSLLAMLAHWTRRHRALALSAAAAIAVAAAGSVLYVRNIAIERDRADSSEQATRRARASAEASLDELTLKHAELLLTTDPSAAIDALASYHGAAPGRADRIRAEAAGRGVALVRALPHTDTIRWAQIIADGAILSLSNDGTISRTSRDGTSTVISRDVAKSAISQYSPSRHLLAYTCNPSDLCLFDVARDARIPVAPLLRGVNPIAVSLSPDGTLLALISRDFGLRVLDIADPARPALKLARSVAGGLDVEFVGDDVVVGSPIGIEFIRMNGDSERYSLPDISRWAAGASEHELALATSKGQALIVESFPLHVVARADLCHGPTADLQFIPGRHSIAYACREGTIGTWDLQQGAVRPRAQLEGHADLITASSTGDHIIAAGGNGTVTVLDLFTDLVASYKGHGARLTTLTPPTPDHPFLISGDVRGGIRVWPLPTRLARVAASSSSPFHRAIFDDRSTTIVATTSLPALTVVSPTTGVRTVEPHLTDNIFLERSGNDSIFATYGRHDLVEIWSSTTMTRTRVIPTGHGSVSRLRFVGGDTDDFITSGHDGRLVRWSLAGQPTVLAQLDRPIDQFARAPATDAIVFSTVDGALWRTGPGGQAVSLRAGGSRVDRILELPDRPMVYAGYASGDVVAIDTKSWQQQTIFHGSGSVREIAITEDGHTLAVATNDGTVHVGTPRDDAASPRGSTWVALPLPARHIALARDGLLVAACTDGTVWLYSPARQRWLCLPTGTVDPGRTAVTADGKGAVTLDFEGRLLWIDLESARKLL